MSNLLADSGLLSRLASSGLPSLDSAPRKAGQVQQENKKQERRRKRKQQQGKEHVYPRASTHRVLPSTIGDMRWSSQLEAHVSNRQTSPARNKGRCEGGITGKDSTPTKHNRSIIHARKDSPSPARKSRNTCGMGWDDTPRRLVLF